MNRLEDNHIDFLKQCAEHPNKIHESDLPVEDLEQMVRESLLIKYGGIKTKYAISRHGTQYVKECLANNDRPVLPEMKAAALKYVMSRGYTQQAAENIVEEWGINYILEAQAKDMRASTQRDVKVPINERGLPEIRFRKG